MLDMDSFRNHYYPCRIRFFFLFVDNFIMNNGFIYLINGFKYYVISFHELLLNILYLISYVDVIYESIILNIYHKYIQTLKL